MSRIDLLILESLKDEEKNGKEIITELNETFGYFWQAKTGTIYPALKRLKHRGLIQENKAKTDDLTTYYELTKRGLRRIKGFKRGHHGFPSMFHFKPPSKPFFKFNFWRKFIDPDTRIEQLQKYRTHLTEELKRIDELIKKISQETEKEEFNDIKIE